MGTNLMRGQQLLAGLESLPPSIRRLLQRIKKHPSKASDTYYFRSFAQYFDDAARSMGEIRRVLKPGCCGVVVVQSSYYKNIPIPLGDLYFALANDLGLVSKIVLRVPVRRVLATINSRAARHEPDRHYTEDVLAFQRAA